MIDIFRKYCLRLRLQNQRRIVENFFFTVWQNNQHFDGSRESKKNRLKQN